MKNLLIVSLLIITSGLNAVAYDFMDNNGICYDKNTDGESVTVTYQNLSQYGEGYSNYTGDVVIPSSVTHNGKTYSVTTIGAQAFNGSSALTSIAIPNSIKSIGFGAFSGCSGLKKVYITDLEAWCNISFGVYEANPLEFAHRLFVNDVEIQGHFEIPTTITSIREQAFKGLSSITGVTIPNSITYIGTEAFAQCQNLTNVIWKAKAITDYSFNESPFLHSGITSIEFGSGVERIPARICLELTELSSVSIPNSVTYIGPEAFNGCRKLTSIEIPNSVVSVGDNAFGECSGLTSVIWNVKSYTDFTSSNCPFKGLSNISTFIFGESVERIPAYICYNLGKLTTVTISDSVTEIGNSAFSGCSGLTTVNIPNLEAWCKIVYGNDESNPLYSDCVHSLRLNGSEITDLVIPGSVTEIKNYAFSRCTSIKSVTIPNSVTSIGDNALAGCNITSLNVPNSAKVLGAEVCAGCTGLRSISIGKAVSAIGDYAFKNCEVLTTINSYPNANDVNLGTKVFDGVPQNVCKLHVMESCLEAYQTTAQWLNFINIIGDLPDDEPVVTHFGIMPEMAVVKPGDTLKLEVTTKGGEAYTLSSDDDSIASVSDDGVVSVHKSGLVAIRATTKSGESTFCAILSQVKGDLNSDDGVDGSDMSILLDIVLDGK